MKKQGTRKLLGLGCALFGFMLIVLSAIDYAVGLSVETSGFTKYRYSVFCHWVIRGQQGQAIRYRSNEGSTMEIITDSIAIRTTPEQIFDFYRIIEENYKAWHPEDHISFTWIKGEPLQEGSVGRFEEFIHGKIHKMDVVYTKIVRNKEIEFKITSRFWRLFYPKSTIIIERKDDHCIFTATTYFRLGPISARSQRVRKQLKAAQKHVKEEGENLKRVLEGDRE